MQTNVSVRIHLNPGYVFRIINFHTQLLKAKGNQNQSTHPLAPYYFSEPYHFPSSLFTTAQISLSKSCSNFLRSCSNAASLEHLLSWAPMRFCLPFQLLCPDSAGTTSSRLYVYYICMVLPMPSAPCTPE